MFAMPTSCDAHSLVQQAWRADKGRGMATLARQAIPSLAGCHPNPPAACCCPCLAWCSSAPDCGAITTSPSPFPFCRERAGFEDHEIEQNRIIDNLKKDLNEQREAARKAQVGRGLLLGLQCTLQTRPMRMAQPAVCSGSLSIRLHAWGGEPAWHGQGVATALAGWLLVRACRQRTRGLKLCACGTRSTGSSSCRAGC